jgi:hypothetical protein
MASKARRTSTKNRISRLIELASPPLRLIRIVENVRFF